MKSIIGRKLGMTNYFNDKGDIVPVTIIEAGPCTVTQVRDDKKDGYSAIQIGFGKEKRLGKAKNGHLKKSKVDSKYLGEVSLEENDEYKVGDTISCDIFKEGDMVKVTGTSKGKGFAGVIKRHNFSRGPMSHGSHHHRSTGAIGGAFPEHVFKGQKMPGQMGAKKVSVKNIRVEKIDPKENIIALKGAIPGPKKSIVLISG